MSGITKGLLVIVAIFAIGIGLLVWKTKVATGEGLTRLSKSDMESILKDAPPQALKRLADDPEQKKKALDDIKQLLALASEARREGLDKEPAMKTQLEFIGSQIWATSYDKEKNKDKGPMPPLGFIKQEDVDAYIAAPEFEGRFNEILSSAKEIGLFPKDMEPKEDQLKQLKDQLARIMIYDAQAKADKDLPEEFKKKAELQTSLQQAAMLARTYSEKKLKDKFEVTDDEVKAYIADHAEFDIEKKKVKAEEVLARIKNGEDFIALAKEFTEENAGKETGGELPPFEKDGQMVKEFSDAAFAMEKGQVSDLVKTQFGYHIIKVDDKIKEKGKDGKEVEKVKARHILFADFDTKNPSMGGPPVALADAAKTALQDDKRKKMIDDIIAKNHIEIADDFEIKVPEMPEGAQGMPPGMPGGQQIDPKQLEQLKKQMEAQQKGGAKGAKPMPQSAPQESGKPSDK